MAAAVNLVTNSALGVQSLCSLNVGSANVAVGWRAMSATTAGCSNTAVGASAGAGAQGNSNVFIGNVAGCTQTSGDANVAIGPNTALASTTGSCQLAIGFSSTDYWLTGDSGKNIQPGAGIRDCANSLGTAGQALLSTGTTVCWGAAGGASDATPTVAGVVKGCIDGSNSALGCNALFSNTTGDRNTAIGANTLYSNTDGERNTANGYNALFSNTTGCCNTANGLCALYCNTTGCKNTANGGNALRFNTTGTANTANGEGVLYSNTTGSYNTAIGTKALCSNTTGCGNVMIGGTDSAGDFVPVFDVTTENNRIAMGSTSVTNAYVQVAWTVVSDARDKTNVTALPVGLNFVNQLNPVSFQFKESRECDTATGPVRYGFLAQEVLAAEGENPVIVDTEVPDHLKVTNDHFNAVLVKAIQELSAKVDSLERKLATNG